MKKSFAIAMTASVIVITALVILIVYLLKKGDYFGRGSSGAGQIEPSSQTAELAEQTDETYDAENAPDPDTIDIDSITSADARQRPEGWYGSFESSGPVEIDIDLESFAVECPDVYAWIEIPGTDIDYPIAYCEDAVEPFWFSHDIHGNPDENGMIITDSLNGKDFSDPVTLVYGKSPGDDTMFAQLHAFRDAQFFADHDHVNIYTEDAELVYIIYACYIGPADHIFASNDFSDSKAFTEYFDSIGEIRDLSMNIREDAKPGIGDHVISLITHCEDDDKRLFIHAVLDEVRY